MLLWWSVAALGLSAPAAFAADENCAGCGQEASIGGEFAHGKSDASLTIEGAGSNAAAFYEEIYGENFTVTIAHLPAGKYTIAIGEAETWAGAPGERTFSVTSGDTALAKDFDIFAAAGGARKVCYITGVVEHEDDSLKGPLAVSFTGSKNNAKFNTFEVKNASGAPVVSFRASEMADAFSAEAVRLPEISDPPIWRDPSQPLPVRAKDLIRRLSLAEKVAQLQNGAPAIRRLGAKHCTASRTTATLRYFRKPSAWRPPGIRHCFSRNQPSSALKAARSSIITPPSTTATPNGSAG
jgi:beta-glucosidase